MFNIKTDVDKKIHFIGIGGISMSGLAEILLKNGYVVSGSDRASSSLTEKLEALGAKITIGNSSENIVMYSPDVVVYTAAVKEDNPEFIEANNRGLILYNRAEFLGFLMREYTKSIAVAGTHGKTTVTSMISLIFYRAQFDPTIMLGGELNAIGGNVKVGNSSYLIAEACEYKRSFLSFFPHTGLILNIDIDHLDYYKDIDDINDAFVSFSKLIAKDGFLIACAEDSRAMEILSKSELKTISFGITSGDFMIQKLTYDSNGMPSFNVSHKGKEFGSFKLSVPGKHNILNALAAIAAAYAYDIPYKVIADALMEYGGAKRRFEKKGEYNSVTIIDEYAHHPTEIKAAIEAALNYPHKKIYCVFQPHTYTRTQTLFNEFALSFKGIDNLILADIYAAREKDTGLVNSKQLCDAINKNTSNAIYLDSFDAIEAHLKTNLKPGDVLITMGAGDVFKIGERLLK